MPKNILQWLFAIVAGALLVASIDVAPVQAREMVPFAGAFYPGTIVIRTRERRLYYVLGGGYAIRYPVGVGKAGQQWTGVAYIDDMRVAPDWAAPPAMRRDPYATPVVIPGGAPENPMGAAALTLTGGEYAIHGTNQPQSIGGFVSAGCIRMHNQDVVDLFARVTVGTPVVVAR
jgi:lipoprotein-anchoring transpeptidase ErfK/SrfK